jgi:hypothetical protein
MKSAKKLTLMLTAGLILSGLCGCKTMEKLGRKRFTVESSSLDWVQFSRTLAPNGAEPPVTIHLQLDGSGYLQYRIGKSVRVRDDFWQHNTGGNWQDMQTDQIVLSRDETVAFYQRLVDAGIYDYRKKDKERDKHATLAILARIDFQKKLILTNEPVFLKIFEDLLDKFE